MSSTTTAAPGADYAETVESGVHRTTLPGGLRVVTEFVPGVRSASVGVWVGVGSRDEKPSVAGAAHFLEHLLFKATPSRSALDIAESMDAVGGELNAFTSKEHTCYYAHVIDEDLDLALDVVSDVVLRGRCRSQDVDVERQVVLEELAMRDDDPEDLIGDAMLTALFGDHPLGRPVIGSEESVLGMRREQLRSFHVRRYVPAHMVVAVAGNVDHRETVDIVRRCFADRVDPAAPVYPSRPARFRGRTRAGLELIDRDGEQTHLMVAAPAYGRHDARRWALSVLNTAVGGGLSSRLFQEVREKRGLAYSVYSGTDTFADTGALSIYAGCQPENVGDVARVVTDVLADVARDGLTEVECARAKGSLRGSVVLGLEDSASRMNRIGRSELAHGRHWAVGETLDRIAAVTVDDVRAVAADVLGRPLATALVGPYAHERDVPEPVRALVGRSFRELGR